MNSKKCHNIVQSDRKIILMMIKKSYHAFTAKLTKTVGGSRPFE